MRHVAVMLRLVHLRLVRANEVRAFSVDLIIAFLWFGRWWVSFSGVIFKASKVSF